jgi:PelA/Pel-15E family pectate lyase
MNHFPHPCYHRFVEPLFCIALLVTLGFASPIAAAIIGTNPPVLTLTAERIASLPAAARMAWKEYLEHSARQRKADQLFFENEMKDHDIKQSVVPPTGHASYSMPLDNRAIWYSSDDARRIADNIVSFQTPAGGWSKNLDLTRHPRAAGELFGPENGSQFLGASDFDAPLDGNWNYVGTIDNDATTTELQFLAKVIAAVGTDKSTSYRASFLRGLDYLFAAQYPNGGWPQVWPLQGGYHDAITFNDGAILNVLELLRGVSEAKDEFAFVPEKIRGQAAASLKRGMECILAAQIVSNNRRTVWCQQYDALAVQPTSARNYEMPSQASGESAGIMMFLMQLPDPSPEVVTAVHAAAAWFEKTKLMNVAFKSTGSDGRHLVSAPGNGPIWARYYEIGDDKPIFGDRDKSIHDTVDEISKERRQGYSWYGNTAKRALEHYAHWSKTHPIGK